jgi:hypothetical protein
MSVDSCWVNTSGTLPEELDAKVADALASTTGLVPSDVLNCPDRPPNAALCHHSYLPGGGTSGPEVALSYWQWITKINGDRTVDVETRLVVLSGQWGPSPSA